MLQERGFLWIWKAYKLPSKWTLLKTITSKYCNYGMISVIMGSHSYRLCTTAVLMNKVSSLITFITSFHKSWSILCNYRNVVICIPLKFILESSWSNFALKEPPVCFFISLRTTRQNPLKKFLEDCWLVWFEVIHI